MAGIWQRCAYIEAYSAREAQVASVPMKQMMKP